MKFPLCVHYAAVDNTETHNICCGFFFLHDTWNSRCFALFFFSFSNFNFMRVKTKQKLFIPPILCMTRQHWCECIVNCMVNVVREYYFYRIYEFVTSLHRWHIHSGTCVNMSTFECMLVCVFRFLGNKCWILIRFVSLLFFFFFVIFHSVFLLTETLCHRLMPLPTMPMLFLSLFLLQLFLFSTLL